MTKTIQAIYEDGVFHPTEPVSNIPEHTRIKMTFETPPSQEIQKPLYSLFGKMPELANISDEEIQEAKGLWEREWEKDFEENFK